MRLIVSKPTCKGFQRCLLAAIIGIGGASLSTLQARERFTALRDSSGRVVFTNEEPAELTSRQSTAPFKISPAAASPQRRERAKNSAGPGPAVQSTWNEAIERTASRHQVDPDLVRAMVQVESNFNPFAISSRGAGGLMQLVPSTARRFGVGNVFDPGANLDGGVRYLKYLMNMFGGDLKLSLAAYNAGENAVDRHNGVPPFPETWNYLRKISEIYPLNYPVPSPGRSRAEIAKFVDSNGIVHFNNTDLP